MEKLTQPVFKERLGQVLQRGVVKNAHATCAELQVWLGNGEHLGGIRERQNGAGVFEILFCCPS